MVRRIRICRNAILSAKLLEVLSWTTRLRTISRVTSAFGAPTSNEDSKPKSGSKKSVKSKGKKNSHFPFGDSDSDSDRDGSLTDSSDGSAPEDDEEQSQSAIRGNAKHECFCSGRPDATFPAVLVYVL